MSEPHYFGVRHHGPGCARSLVRAFEALQPDCVLIEGPPEGDSLLPLVVHSGMQPPVALLSHAPDDTGLAVYHPFAVFSPEWQAARWAVHAEVPVRFIDLPVAHGLALEKARRETLQAEDSEASGVGETPEATTQTTAADNTTDNTTDSAADITADDTSADTTEAPHPSPDGDPLTWLAQAAGYADGEAWWNHMVEERGDGEELFAAIAEAMLALRAEWGEERHRSPEHARREALREAHMRQCIRAAQKEGFERIAVVCGAWHLGGLQGSKTTAKADQALLKGLPKLKVQSTWVPWTYRHLASASGYGAGIDAPGWYEHLWLSHESRQPRAVG